jgi:hypothetical protein
MKTVRAMLAGCLECFCRALATVVVVATLEPGCHASGARCFSVGLVSPIITVTDARTGAAICDATVVVVEPPDASVGIPPDSSYWQLQPWVTLLDGDMVPADGGSTVCTYDGAGLRGEGGFNDPLGIRVTLVVSKPGYRTATATALTKGYGCDDPNPPPAPDQVDVMLQPDPVPNHAGSEG